MISRKTQAIFFAIAIPFVWMVIVFRIINIISGDVISQELVNDFLARSTIWENLELLFYLGAFYYGWYQLGLGLYRSIMSNKGSDKT